MFIVYNEEMTSLQIGIIVTLGVIVTNLVIFFLMPLGIRKLLGRQGMKV